jgi:inner membrane protein
MRAITRDHGDLLIMASLITHAAVGIALGQAATRKLRQRPVFWAVAVLCSILPDFDVIGFQFGVRYGNLWGHRGMTHSLLFAAVAATVFAIALGDTAKDRCKLAGLLFLVTASHGVLDALTNGGLGVAFFSPFDRHRYFFPWRPIWVSPIGARALFSSRALQVMQHEFWVWAPALTLSAVMWAVRRRKEARALTTTSQPALPVDGSRSRAEDSPLGRSS